MSEDYIADTLAVIEQVLRSVRPELLENYGLIDHDIKPDDSLVTRLDKEIESNLKNALKPLDQNVGFYGEEYGLEGSQNTFWTIDPIDGTDAFIRGMPFCTNMTCLISDGQPIASLIYNFVLDELFTAIMDKGAFLNGKPTSVSEKLIEYAAIEYESHYEVSELRKNYVEIPRYRTYRFSAAGYGFTQVARGALEARVQHNPYGNIWDYAPGALLVREAGGMVANIGSSTYDYNNTSFIASNQQVHDQLQKAFAG
jgi:fructose-1,6-bisphosphatase/inositol monophosphatase family enzyme